MDEKEKIEECRRWAALFTFMVTQASHSALSVNHMKVILLNDINLLKIDNDE